MKLKIKFPIEHKGGQGSGHHGHSGRPGKHGGSAPGTGGGSGSSSGGSVSSQQEFLDGKVAPKLPAGFTKGIHGDYNKRVTGPAGKYVDISVSPISKPPYVQVWVDMRNSDNTKITSGGGKFFWPTGLEAIDELIGGGKFPSAKSVRKFGGFRR